MNSNRWSSEITRALRSHWPEYLMEAAQLGVFVLTACTFTILLFHPASVLSNVVPEGLLRRLLIGLAMGATAIAIIFSPFGKRSGAHFNPSVTITYFRLGKVKLWDAVFYILAQFTGGLTGIFVASMVFGQTIADSRVRFAVTIPGKYGIVSAFIAECIISFILMSVVLRVSNNRTLSNWTGVFAGLLVAAYITLESPISGMSMNPARTFSSGVAAGTWTSMWIYFIAPPVGMLAAAEVFTRSRNGRTAACAKLHHNNSERCIFQCDFNKSAFGQGGKEFQS